MARLPIRRLGERWAGQARGPTAGPKIIRWHGPPFHYPALPTGYPDRRQARILLQARISQTVVGNLLSLARDPLPSLFTYTVLSLCLTELF
jgi:hypothetical protein